jgi:acyl carrier protein
MQTQVTFEQFVGVLDEVAGIDPETVLPEQSLIDDLDIDSLTMVEILLHIEDRFGIKVDEDEARSLHTVADVVARLEKAESSA